MEKYLADKQVIGSTVIEALDGELMLMYSSVDGKHFLKSSDHFRTISESWIVPMDSITANANLIRLKDNRLMMVIRKVSDDPKIAEVLGASFYVTFSEDDGHTFSEMKRINSEEACYYVMNHRILRTHTGRIIIPVCYVPTELIMGRELFEKTGWSGCFYSDDEGETWQTGEWLKAEIVDQLCEPMVAEGTDGVLHMYMRTGYGYLYRSRSFDDGVTWEPECASELRSPTAPFCIGFDSYTDTFYAVWDNSFPSPLHGCPRSPICLAQSKDCINWNMICELDKDPMRSYGYPMIYFTEDELIITYYENEDRRFCSETQKLKLKIISR